MHMRLAVAFIVATVLAGAAGIVAEAFLRVPVGTAQPQARVLAGLLLAMATGMAHPAELYVVREIGGGGPLPSKVRRA